MTVSPTTALHERELWTWALIAAAGAAGARAGRARLPAGGALDPARCAGSTRAPAGSPPRPPGGAAEPVADDSGPPELRRLSASFDRMAETVTGALAAQRVVADASHQLRNPLTALRLRLSNLNGHVDGAAADDHGAALEEAELSELLDDCSRWPGPSAQRRWSTSTSTPRWPTGSRPGGRSPSTPGCAWTAPRRARRRRHRSEPWRPCSTPCWTTR